MHRLGNNYAALVFRGYCAGITGQVEMLLAPTAVRAFVFHWMNWSQIIFYWSQIFFIEAKYFLLKPNILHWSQIFDTNHKHWKKKYQNCLSPMHGHPQMPKWFVEGSTCYVYLKFLSKQYLCSCICVFACPHIISS